MLCSEVTLYADPDGALRAVARTNASVARLWSRLESVGLARQLSQILPHRPGVTGGGYVLVFDGRAEDRRVRDAVMGL